jgi:hypothetical protein
VKIKDLPKNKSLINIKFKHPKTGETCFWLSQWGYPEGKAGVWYKKDLGSDRVFPLSLNKLEEALELEVIK